MHKLEFNMDFLSQLVRRLHADVQYNVHLMHEVGEQMCLFGL